MLLSLLIAASAAEPPTQALPPRQAEAFVTIVAAEAIRFAEVERTAPERLRDSVIRGEDGQPTSARLIEFE